jgi:hypothetical protein
MNDEVLVVAVRQFHLERGEPYNARTCPVALALNEADPDWEWTVGKARIHARLRCDPDWKIFQRWVIPPVLAAYVDAFDMGVEVGPLTLTLTEREK